MSSVYKIIFKVLHNKLKAMLEKVISRSHNAFIRGRQILDLVLIAKKCLDSKIRLGVPGVLSKLDLEKADNHVNWDFLLYMLRICGFGERWRYWITHCILIDGTPSTFFNSSRGLREGKPHPLLFVVVLEALSRMLSATMNKGLLSGFSLGSRVIM